MYWIPELHILVLLVLLCLGRIIILLCLFDLRFFIRNILFQNVQICQKGDQLGVQFIDLILGSAGNSSADWKYSSLTLFSSCCVLLF